MNTTSPHAAVSESEALRRLNMPNSRRDQLRQRVAGIQLSSGAFVYPADQIEQLAADPQSGLSDRRAAPLHTR